MSKKRNIGNELIESVKEAIAYMRGKKTGVLVHEVKLKIKLM